MSVLEYLAVSTRVLGLKYCSTCKEVLIVTHFLCVKIVSRTKEVYNIGLYILKRFTIILSFLLAIILKLILNIRQEVNVIVAAFRAAKANRFMNFCQ